MKGLLNVKHQNEHLELWEVTSKNPFFFFYMCAYSFFSQLCIDSMFP